MSDTFNAGAEAQIVPTRSSVVVQASVSRAISIQIRQYLYLYLLLYLFRQHDNFVTFSGQQPLYSLSLSLTHLSPPSHTHIPPSH